jgi:DNA-binding transcriptional LysR family regulator
MIHLALSFVAVVNAGSFSKAAKTIGVSKAQLSRHVNQLETALGIQLLYRTTRSIALTESGEQFFLNCRDIEERYEEAIDQLKQEFHAIKGTLTITAPISYGSEYLPELIYQFTQHYPNIKIILSLTNTAEDLVEKNFDLSIRIAPYLSDSNLRMRIISTLEMILCASPSYLEKHGTPTTLKELKNHRCVSGINRDMRFSTNPWPVYNKNKKILFVPNSYIEVDGFRAQTNLVTLGAGIGRLPSLFVDHELKSGLLKQVLPTISHPPYYVYLLYTNRKNTPKKLQLFLEFIKTHETLFTYKYRTCNDSFSRS